jgi:hypothetical protein
MAKILRYTKVLRSPRSGRLPYLFIWPLVGTKALPYLGIPWYYHTKCETLMRAYYVQEFERTLRREDF